MSNFVNDDTCENSPRAEDLRAANFEYILFFEFYPGVTVKLSNEPLLEQHLSPTIP